MPKFRMYRSFGPTDAHSAIHHTNSSFRPTVVEKSETELTASVLTKDPKTHKRLKADSGRD